MTDSEQVLVDDRAMLDAWLVGADFPMAPVVRRLLADYDHKLYDWQQLAEASERELAALRRLARQVADTFDRKPTEECVKAVKALGEAVYS